MNKETLPMIGRLLGHANLQTTARYAHLDDGHLIDAVPQGIDILLGTRRFDSVAATCIDECLGGPNC